MKKKVSRGTKHDTGKPPISLVPMKALAEVARVLDFGKKKYTAQNWRRGIEYSRLLDASLRHTAKFIDGQDLDEESKTVHLANAACNLLFCLEFYLEGRTELDDRYKPSKGKKK